MPTLFIALASRWGFEMGETNIGVPWDFPPLFSKYRARLQAEGSTITIYSSLLTATRNGFETADWVNDIRRDDISRSVRQAIADQCRGFSRLQ